MQTKLTTLKAAAKRVFAVALAVLMLGLALASASESLHQALHHHHEEEHSPCAVCLVSKGLLDAPETPAFLPIVVFLAIAAVSTFVPISAGRSDFLLPPGRAPPQTCSIH